VRLHNANALQVLPCGMGGNSQPLLLVGVLLPLWFWQLRHERFVKPAQTYVCRVSHLLKPHTPHDRAIHLSPTRSSPPARCPTHLLSFPSRRVRAIVYTRCARCSRPSRADGSTVGFCYRSRPLVSPRVLLISGRDFRASWSAASSVQGFVGASSAGR
jgi:hypothetical protein